MKKTKLRRLKIKYWEIVIKNRKQDIEIGNLIKEIKKHELEAWQNKKRADDRAEIRKTRDLLVTVVKEAILQAKVEVKREEVKNRER